MIFYVIATIIYMKRVLFHTPISFHVGHLCVYVCGTHVKWKANNALNAKRTEFLFDSNKCTCAQSSGCVRVWVGGSTKKREGIRQGICHFKSNLSCSNIYYIVFDVCRNGNGFIHFWNMEPSLFRVYDSVRHIFHFCCAFAICKSRSCN